jgi:hypothetical protein
MKAKKIRLRPRFKRERNVTKFTIYRERIVGVFGLVIGFEHGKEEVKSSFVKKKL